jgi:ribose 1,5-bisphosphokinase
MTIHHPTALPGRLIVIVGPSGAGKDSLMEFARRHYAADPAFGVVQRLITRPKEAGGENHRSVTLAEFDEIKREGLLAVDWQAHGLSYGIPDSSRLDLARGMTLIVNGSRGALDLFRSAYGSIDCVLVTARPDVLAERLAARGRESRQDIAARLSRQIDVDDGHYNLVIDNSGGLEDAGARLVSYLDMVRAGPT